MRLTLPAVHQEVDVKTAFVFPGQGAQRVGMGREIYERFPAVRDLFARASESLGIDMAALCFHGPEAELMLTENVQPAVTLVSIACLELFRSAGGTADAAAGHSLGEYAALYAAGVIPFEYTLRIVRRRGEFMRDAAAGNPGGMLAVMGLDPQHIGAVCEKAGAAGVVEVANHNSPLQIIFTGQAAALEAVAEEAGNLGAVRSVPLKVSGPWHSSFMAPAAEMLRRELELSCFHRPQLPVVANVTGDYYANVAAMRAGLIEQVSSPVQWVRSVQKLVADGVRLFVELGPGSTLAGLIRDIDKSVRVVSVGDPDGLGRAVAAMSDAVPDNQL